MAAVPPPGHKSGAEPSSLPPATPGRVRLWVGGKPRSKPRAKSPSPWWLKLCMGLLAGTGMVVGMVLLVFSFRWGLLLMVDPEAFPRLQAWLESPLTPRRLTAITTQTELQQTVEAAGQILGPPVKLTEPQEGEEWLVFPILAADTGAIVQLRVFQRPAGSPALASLAEVAAVAVAPFAPEQILAPLSPKDRQAKVTPQAFVPRQLMRLPDPPAVTPYYWLTLEGQWASQGTRLQYGQLLVFEPARQRVALLEVWSSPARQLPQWTDLDGSGLPDLMINETSGIEPMLQGLQVADSQGMGPPVRLQPVSWMEVPLDASTEANPYQTALRLARSGLWREAHARLEDLKPALAEQWNPAAEAQLRMTARHADLTQRQANQEWSMPSQKVMALLIDGQWEAALDFLEQSPGQVEPLMRRLGADQGRLWNRISTAASLPEADPAVFIWGGLTLEAQQNRQAAQTWLARQPVTAAARDRMMALLATLNQPGDPAPRATATDSSPTAPAGPGNSSSATLPPVQGVMGQVRPLSQVSTDDWYFPEQQAPTLVTGEQWYLVEVPLVRTDQQWQTDWLQGKGQTSTAQLWAALPFNRNPSLTMVRWESSTLGVSQNLYVKGLKLGPNAMILLAAGTPMPKTAFAPLAFSEGSLVWLSAERHITPVSSAIIPPLMEEILRHNGSLPHQDNPSALAPLLQQVKLHSLDLTGDGRPEQVLTFDPPTLDQLQGLGIRLDRTAHKTVILSQDNELLYSDLFQPQTLVALTNPEDVFPLSLVVHRQNSYQLVGWSASAGAFGP